jgi:DNA repair protein RecO (recombination protein O)
MPIPHVYKADGIVLRHIDYGEADRILTIMTREYGKLRAIAKGARKVTSKLASTADLLTRTQFVLASGRELDIVTQGSTLERFDHLRDSLWHGSAAYAVAEMLDRGLEDRAEVPVIYTLTLDTLRRLDSDAASWLADPTSTNAAGPATRGWAALLYFELRLLDQLGYKPNVSTCVACENQLEPLDGHSFNAELGGALCPACSRYSQRRLPLLSLKVLRLVQRTPWKNLPVMRIDSATRSDVDSIMQSILALHLDRSLRSWNFLQHLPPI